MAPGFVREVLDVYDAWNGKKSVPTKVEELMMVLRIEVSRLYAANLQRRGSEMPKVPMLKDTRLS